MDSANRSLRSQESNNRGCGGGDVSRVTEPPLKDFVFIFYIYLWCLNYFFSKFFWILFLFLVRRGRHLSTLLTSCYTILRWQVRFYFYYSSGYVFFFFFFFNLKKLKLLMKIIKSKESEILDILNDSLFNDETINLDPTKSNSFIML